MVNARAVQPSPELQQRLDEIRERSSPRRGMTPTGARLIVTAVAGACAFLVVALPRPIAPREMPPLVLAESDVATEREHRHGEANTAGLERLIAHAKAASAEELGIEIEGRLDNRALRQELTEHEAELPALRVWALERYEAALAGELDGEELQQTLGAFPRVLERYDAARDGFTRAPDFVVETIFLARLNLLLGLPPTDGFSDVSLQAYHGWLGLHAEAAAPELRRGALQGLDGAGGAGALEGAALLAFRGGDLDAAASAYGSLYETTGLLRLRNHAMAAQGHVE